MDGPRADGLHPLMMLLRNASLTTTQQDQVHQLMTAHRSQVEPLLDRLHTLTDQIADKLLGSSAVVTAQDMASLSSEASQVQEQIDASDMDTALKIRNLLTADQRTHLASVHRQVKSLRDQLDALLRPGSSSAGQRP
jgi:Spy/CpxP family protein refolding chaperone